jgi:hypothetical protein
MPQGLPVWEWRHGREAAELCLCRRLTHIAASGGNERRRGRERGRRKRIRWEGMGGDIFLLN